MYKGPINRPGRSRSVAALMVRSAGATLVCLATALGAQDSAQEGRSQQVFTTVCGRCHPLERVTTMRRTRNQWEETIDTMITTRGAQISDEDYDTVLAYLTQEYGRVDINRAPPDDIVEVVGIPGEMATAIVAYRKQHGPFEDFDALMRVPGLNRDAIEKKRDAISF